MAETNKRGYPNKWEERVENSIDSSGGIGTNLNNTNWFYTDTLDALRTPSEAPQYEDKYGGQVDKMLSAMQNRGEFSYDHNSDPVYQAYRQQYLREGQRAAEDTMGQAAAMTGGRPSSYAVAAAQQQQNYYNSQLNDKIPELYNQAYNRYMQEFQNQAQMTQMLQNQQQYDYNRFSQDRAFSYNQNQDRINNLMSAWKTSADIAANERDFRYNQEQDKIRNLQTQQSQDFNRWLQQAQMALQVGDFSLLQSMGFNTSRAGFADDLAIAQIIAQLTGDTSRLRALMGR